MSMGKFRLRNGRSIMFQVFAPFPKIQDVFIKTFPYGGRSAFITFSHVVEADKAYELAFQSAKKSHNLQLR